MCARRITARTEQLVQKVHLLPIQPLLQITIAVSACLVLLAITALSTSMTVHRVLAKTMELVLMESTVLPVTVLLDLLVTLASCWRVLLLSVMLAILLSLLFPRYFLNCLSALALQPLSILEFFFIKEG